jgi:protein regulator of cytokinesis 1
LGGNVKATGNNVGDFRKEKVLPHRYHLVAEYREKLRQVGPASPLRVSLSHFSQLYHSKLEQLTSLTNRLTALCRTLGPDFYCSDIVDPTPAAGENSKDPSAHRDVTPERFSKLEKELVRGKAEVVSHHFFHTYRLN